MPASSSQSPPDTSSAAPDQGTANTGTTANNGSGAAPGGSTSTAMRPLYLRMFMDKTVGLTIEVLDAAGINQQSITMDGSKTTLRVSGMQGDSVITQTADTVSVNARNFNVQADKIVLNSTSGSSFQSMGQTNISSLSELSLMTTGSLSQTGLNGINLNGLSMAINAMTSISLLAVGGGIAACGGAGGVQIFGTDISLTGVSVAIAAPTTSITSADLQFGAMPGPPQGSAASSGDTAAKGGEGAGTVGAGAASGAAGSSTSLSSAGSMYGMNNGSGMGGTSGANDTGSLLHLGSTGVFGGGLKGGTNSGTASTYQSPAMQSMNSTMNQYGQMMAPVLGFDPAKTFSTMTGQAGLNFSGSGSLLSGPPNPYAMESTLTHAGSQMIGSATDRLMSPTGNPALDTALMVTGPSMLALAAAGYAASGYLDWASKVDAKIANGTLTAGDLLGASDVMLAAIGKVAIKLLQNLSKPLLGGEDDTNCLFPGVKPGDQDGISSMMENFTPPKESGGSSMYGSMFQENPSVMATILGKISKKKMDSGADKKDSGSKDSKDKKGLGGTDSKDATDSKTASSSKGAKDSASKTGASGSASKSATSSDLPTITALISELDPTLLKALTPKLAPQILTGLANILGPSGFLTVLSANPGLSAMVSGASELKAHTSALLPPGFRSDLAPPAKNSAAAAGATATAGPAATANPASPAAPAGVSASATSASATTPAAGSGVSAAASVSAAPLTPSAAGSGTLQGQPPNANAGGASSGEPPSTEATMSTMLTLGGLMRNQWSLGMPTMDHVLPNLLPRGGIKSPTPATSGASAAVGQPRSTPDASDTSGTSGTSGTSAAPGAPSSVGGAPPAGGQDPAGAATPGAASTDPAAQKDQQGADDGGIDAAINEAFAATLTALGPLGVAAQGALGLVVPSLNFLTGLAGGQSPLAGLTNPGQAAQSMVAGAKEMSSTNPAQLAQNPSQAASKLGGGGGGGTLLDEMKKKGSLLTGEYGTQFSKVLEKTYGSVSKGLSLTLHPMDTMSLMSGQFQTMMIPEKQPFETAGVFSLSSKPKTVAPETELPMLMNYGQNSLQVQQQLAKFMQDLLAKPDSAAKDPAAKDPAASDSAAKDSTTTAPVAKDPAATDPAVLPGQTGGVNRGR